MNIRVVIASFALLVVLAGCHTSRTAGNGRGLSSAAKAEIATEGIATGDATLIVPLDPAMADQARLLFDEACRWLGTPYLFGGTSASGIDCSAFTQTVFANALDMKLPRNSGDQYRFGTRLERSQLLPGDLVFFRPRDMANRVGHVGLYIGNDQMIHASRSGVVVTNLSTNYYVTHIYGYGRVLPESAFKKQSKPRDISKSDKSDKSDESKKSDKKRRRHRHDKD